MFVYNEVPNCNREVRRKVEKYRRKHKGLTFTQAYNQLFGTDYDEPHNREDDTSMQGQNNNEKSPVSTTTEWPNQ